MPETYVPHEHGKKILIRMMTGYDRFKKPIFETHAATQEEIDQLRKQGNSFEIMMKPEDYEEIDKTI